MRPKKIIKKLVSSLPIHQELQQHITIQQNEITGLRQAVERLENRNRLWEEEVRSMRGEAKSLEIVWPVKKKDLIAANWQSPGPVKSVRKPQPPFTFNWVMLPMGLVSGGHTDIFRTISYLESQGHTCRIYFYDEFLNIKMPEIEKNMKNYPAVKAKLFYNAKSMEPCDAIFATSWYSAYPVFNYSYPAKKFYFVQDFEPYFDPVGSYSTLAENTYKFGFYGITLGRWLSDTLTKKYGMACDSFELGVNLNEYKLSNTKARKKILFYARPVTPRRGFELGVLALEIFHEKHPEYEINFLGWDITPYKIPFPYINNSILSPEKLNKLYNECAAGLVLSFTNMSLLPLEMLASGCIPVVNDAEHTRMVSYAKALKFAVPSPSGIADTLERTVGDPTIEVQAEQAAQFAQKFQWDNSNQKIEEILTRELTK